MLRSGEARCWFGGWLSVHTVVSSNADAVALVM